MKKGLIDLETSAKEVSRTRGVGAISVVVGAVGLDVEKAGKSKSVVRRFFSPVSSFAQVM